MRNSILNVSVIALLLLAANAEAKSYDINVDFKDGKSLVGTFDYNGGLDNMTPTDLTPFGPVGWVGSSMAINSFNLTYLDSDMSTIGSFSSSNYDSNLFEFTSLNYGELTFMGDGRNTLFANLHFDGDIIHDKQLNVTFANVAIGNSQSLVYSASGFSTHNILLNDASAVPEPSEYAMFLAGLGLIGFSVHRKLSDKAIAV